MSVIVMLFILAIFYRNIVGWGYGPYVGYRHHHYYHHGPHFMGGHHHGPVHPGCHHVGGHHCGHRHF